MDPSLSETEEKEEDLLSMKNIIGIFADDSRAEQQIVCAPVVIYVRHSRIPRAEIPSLTRRMVRRGKTLALIRREVPCWEDSIM